MTNKLGGIRARTWLVLAVLVVAIIFYFLITITFNNEINYIHLIFMGVIGISVHFSMYPEGENFGKRQEIFVSNKKCYNARAFAVNEQRLVKELREYCDHEYEERKKRYIDNQCGMIGIDSSEFEYFKTLSKKEIKKLNSIEIKGKLIWLTSKNKKRLCNLLFRSLPIERNNANSILSACEIDETKAVKDKAKTYTAFSHITKIISSTIIAIFFAYIGYTFKDGIVIETIAMIIFYLTAIIITAIFSFSSGETEITVYKNKYYIDLSIYLDCVAEWLKETKNKELELKLPE